jgi:hypothetical protein
MSDTDPMADDGFFIGYCDIHCETDRALFSYEHCVRLYRLAGHDVDDPTTQGFHAMHEAEAKPLIKQARERLRD